MKSWIVLLGIGWAFGCSDKRETFEVLTQPLTISVYASGIVKANTQYDLFPTVPGKVLKVLKSPGQEVKKGDTLLILDIDQLAFQMASARDRAKFAQDQASTYSAQIQEIRDRLSLAQAKKNQDSLLLERQRRLFQEKIGAKIELEQRELAFEASKTEVANLRSRLRLLEDQLQLQANVENNQRKMAEIALEDRVICAQSSGVLYDLIPKVGETVSPNRSVATIGEKDLFFVELTIDEYDVLLVQPGQKVVLTLDSRPGEVLEAELSLIRPMMQSATRTFLANATFSKPMPGLYPGLSAEANIIIETKPKALLIPIGYLVSDSLVYISPETTTRVKTGDKNLEWVEVMEGLKEGQIIYAPLPK